MAFSVVITNTSCINFYEDVHDAFHQLNIGVVDSVVPYREMTETGAVYKGLRVNFESVADNLFAKQFYERLVSNYELEKAGESVVYPRVIYGTKRDGSDMFWYVSLIDPNELRPIIFSKIRPPATSITVRVDM